ncbi:hypothetical protein MAIT1_04912 [Magnetofaba australis IT-1]|uniref:PAS domain-containing protein n=2 Tax=Magnetofaba australis IT-1 TaxID=1434232 RepID=A0A1Y2KCW8_9PROT|nr:hypothetical protein MAIT1_04912 [Magnetofaba australis IT-1]
MEKTTVLFATKNANGDYAYANKRFLESFGLEGEAYQGKSDFSLLQEAIAKEMWESDLKALRQGGIIENEILLQNEARRRHIRCNHQCVKDETGKPIAFIVEGKDVTLNKEAEEKLRIAARVFNQTGEAIIVTDPSGIIQTVNSAFTEVTGFSFSEAVGKGANILKSG